MNSSVLSDIGKNFATSYRGSPLNINIKIINRKTYCWNKVLLSGTVRDVTTTPTNIYDVALCNYS